MKAKALIPILFISLLCATSLVAQEENERIKKRAEKEEQRREKILNKMITKADRHKPFRIRTAFGNTKFADIDIDFLDPEQSYLLGIDIPTFTIYDQLYIGFSTFANVSILDEEEVDLSTFVVYGANANLNYSFRIIDGLYIVPLIGYGYIGVSENEFFLNDEVDPNNPDDNFEQPFGFNEDGSGNYYFNYGVFLDFSFNLEAKGIGITAGYDYFSGFTFGIKL